MKSLLLAAFAAYLIAAIHLILAFINKRRSVQRVAEWSIATGFILHTTALIADWAIDGHYPLVFLRETLSFLAWALVAAYALILYRYRTQALGVFTMPLICALTFIALLIKSDPQEASAWDQAGFSGRCRSRFGGCYSPFAIQQCRCTR